MRHLALFSLFLAVILFAAEPLFAQTSFVSETVTPNILQVQISATGIVMVGRNFTVTASVSNISNQNLDNQNTSRIKDVIVFLNVPKGISVDDKEKEIGTLDPGEIRTVKWTARAKTSGNYIISVEAQGLLNGVTITASDSTSVSAVGSFRSYLLTLLKSFLGI